MLQRSLSALLAVLLALSANAPNLRANAVRTVTPGQSIQAAINAAQPGDTILLQAGLYTESLTLDRAINIVGTGRDQVVLHPYPYQRVMTVTGPLSGTAPLLKGFTIACGLATDAGQEYLMPGCEHIHTGPAPGRLPYDEYKLPCRRVRGGGICVLPSVSVELDAMRMISNLAVIHDTDIFAKGGAILMNINSVLTVTNSELRTNSADVDSGIGTHTAFDQEDALGVERVYVANSQFIDNRSLGVGALRASRLTLLNSLFQSNGSGSVHVTGPATIRGNRFIDNIGQCHGAAIQLYGLGGDQIVEGNVFVNNVNYDSEPAAGDQCGEVTYLDRSYYTGPFYEGESRLILRRNTFRGRAFQALALEGTPSSRVSIQDSVFVGYPYPLIRVTTYTDHLPIHVSNVIVSDTEAFAWSFGPTYPITAPFVFTAMVTGISASNIISADPRLAPDGYHLLLDSPAIDAGVPGAPSTDIDGQYRPQRGAPDIGADEFYDAVALDDLNVACPPSSNGLTAIDAQASPANASRPVTYTVSTADEPPRLYTGWSSATLGVGWALPGAKTVMITATNPHGSIARNCVVNVSAPARAVWVPVLER